MKATQYQINYQREFRKWAKEQHICARCKEKDERTLAGRTYCEKCAAKYREYYRKKVMAQYEQSNGSERDPV